MMRLVALLALAIASISTYASDARPAIPRELDPDGLMHGVPFGATESQIVAALGPPDGYVQLSESRKALFFGRSRAIVLRNGLFSELHISEWLFDWNLAQRMEERPYLSSKRWVLVPGITADMDFERVAALLRQEHATPGHRLEYETKKAQIDLTFSSFVDHQGPERYTLHGVIIKWLGPP